MKYCTDYGCKRLIPDEHDDNICPHCGSGSNSEYAWKKTYIKPLPPEAYEVEQKCDDCGATENLTYHEKHNYGTFHIGNYYKCTSCEEKSEAEFQRQQSMNYVLVDDEDDLFFATEDELESHFESLCDDGDYDYLESYGDNAVVLKVEKIELHSKNFADAFKERNILHYENDWYRVERVIKPTFEADGDLTISI